MRTYHADIPNRFCHLFLKGTLLPPLVALQHKAGQFFVVWITQTLATLPYPKTFFVELVLFEFIMFVWFHCDRHLVCEISQLVQVPLRGIVPFWQSNMAGLKQTPFSIPQLPVEKYVFSSLPWGNIRKHLGPRSNVDIVDLPRESTDNQRFHQLLIPLALNQYFTCLLVSLRG